MYKFTFLLIYSVLLLVVGYKMNTSVVISNNSDELSQAVRMTYMYSCQEQIESYFGKSLQPSEVELKMMNICWIKSENYSEGFKKRFDFSKDLIMSLDGSFYKENKIKPTEAVDSNQRLEEIDFI